MFQPVDQEPLGFFFPFGPNGDFTTGTIFLDDRAAAGGKRKMAF